MYSVVEYSDRAATAPAPGEPGHDGQEVTGFSQTFPQITRFIESVLKVTFGI